MPPRQSDADTSMRSAFAVTAPSNASGWPISSSSRPSPILLVTPQLSSGTSQSAGRPSPMRLVVTQSLILPRKQRVAVLDSHPEVSIGRDISLDPTAPRLRLKEMAVSKFHASIFFNFASRTWSLVDLGSVHGTTVNGTRLSGARQSSQPRELRHTDSIVIGTTILVVHAHRDGLPCTDCAVVNNGDNEIPLFDTKSREVGVPGKPVLPQPQVSARSAITNLRQQLVPAAERSATSLSLSDDSVTRPEYKDRAAMRRARHPQHTEPPPPRPQERPSRPPAPVVAPNDPSLALSGSAVSFTFRRSSPSPNTHASAQSEPVSAPSKPLESNNIGHQLLLKQGWTPGTGLGFAEDARMVPVMVERLPHRAGLGVGSASNSASGVSASSGDEYGHRQSALRAPKQRQKWGSGSVPRRTTGGSRKSDREREREEERDQNERHRDRHRERSRRHPSDEDRVHLHKMRAAEETEIADALGRAGLQDRRVATIAFSSQSSLGTHSAPAYASGQGNQQDTGATSPQQSIGSSRSSTSPPAQFSPGRSSSPPPSIFAASSPSGSSSRHSSMQPSWSRDGSAQPQHQAQSSVSSFSSTSSGMQHTQSYDGSPLTSAEQSHTSSTSSLAMNLTQAALSQHSTSEDSGGGGTTATQSSKDGSSDLSSRPVTTSFVYQSSIFRSRSRKSSSSKSTPIPANTAPRPDPHSLDNILPHQKQQPHVNLFSRHTMMSIMMPKVRPKYQAMSSSGSSKGAGFDSGSGTATEGSTKPDNSPVMRMRRLSEGEGESIQEDDETSRAGQSSPPEATMESGTREGSPMEGVAIEASGSSRGSPMQIEEGDEDEEQPHDTAPLPDPNGQEFGGWGHTFRMISPSSNDTNTSQNSQPMPPSVPPDGIKL